MTGWISIGISVLALIASGLATVSARRSADAAARSAAVAERDEQRQLEEAERNAVRWRLEPDELHQTAEGYAFRLTNDGTKPALHVFLTLPRDSQQRGDVPEGRTINAGSFVTFEAFPPGGTMSMSSAEVLVRWRVRPHGDEYTQRWAWADLL